MFPKINLMKIFYESNGGGGSGNNSNNSSNDNNQSNDNTQQGAPADFESWLTSQDEKLQATVKPLFEAHVRDLQSTVRATRKERDDFQKELRDAIKKLDASSEEAKKFTTLADQLDEANKKAEFYEEAPSNGCRNPKVAYALVKSENLYTRVGAVDWKSLKEVAPELFGEAKKTTQKKTAGAGTDETPSGNLSMNDLIRSRTSRSITTQ